MTTDQFVGFLKSAHALKHPIQGFASATEGQCQRSLKGLATCRFDVDIRMPGRSGLDLLQRSEGAFFRPSR